MKQKSLILVLLLATSLALTACGKDETPAEPDFEMPEVEIVDEPLRCPLDNAVVDEIPVRPILVSIDNNPSARPQTGLTKADIVYEVPAEGGISRYLALFYHGANELIGPVRSARPYMVDIAREWDAVFLHAGGSNDAINYLNQGIVNGINQIYHAKGFHRDKSRKAPHNLYTGIDEILPSIEEKGWWEETEVRAFTFSDLVPQGVTAETVQTSYPYSKISYVYDATSGLYTRMVSGKPYQDRETEEVLTAANIIVQKVSSKVLDNEGRLAIPMTGSGEAWLIRDGVAVEGTWQRKSLDGSTIFRDLSGTEFQLKTGQTWIQVMDQNCKFVLPEPQPAEGQQQ